MNMTTRDNNIRRQTRNVHQKGAYIYAVVEDLIMGFATVRLASNGARLTNLPVVGGQILVGQRVAVDYSAGVPPVVRPVAEEQQPTVGLGLPQGPEVTSSPRRDHSCRVILTTTTPIAYDTLTTISWDEAEYQTDSFWSGGAPNKVTIPMDGVFIFLVDLSWGPSHDHWDEVHHFDPDYDKGYWVNGLTAAWPYDYEPLRVEISCDVHGYIGTREDYPVTSEPSVGKMMQCMCSNYCNAGDEITVKVYQQTRASSMDLVPKIDQASFLGTRMTVQWMGATNEGT